ncbi:MAG TPA: hypothetical protein VKB86_06795, partial [Pyrinomonadaceae bacterium]|nr:hypothetical protein [Pyrinomonadaceae bacterium]
EDELRQVIDSTLPQGEIPTYLAVSVVQIPPVGRRLTTAIQINRDSLTFVSDDGKQAADIDLGGIVYDDKGKPANSFVARLKVYPHTTDAPQSKGNDPIYSFNTWLPPGLYQVRIGLRDSRSGRIGSAMEWVQIQ